MNKLANICGYKSAKNIGHERPCELYPKQDLVWRNIHVTLSMSSRFLQALQHFASVKQVRNPDPMHRRSGSQ